MQELHIVSFDIPYPANYGGAIDVFHRIKELSLQGVAITLHCFQYGERQPQQELEYLCKEVHYYIRKTGVSGISLRLPYIVYSRRDSKLLERLSHTQSPIIFEGIHSCYYLNHSQLKSKTKIVRCMNVEHEYYQLLASQARGFKKLYYTIEAKLLKRFESVLAHAQHLLAITSQDEQHFNQYYPEVPSITLTAFHGNELKTLHIASGNYALFHGSLNVIENENAALFLAEDVWDDIKHPLIIAGRNPSKKLIATLSNKPNINLIADPSQDKLDKLVNDAHVHLMYATQSSGLKLKFMKALFQGKHVIANGLMVTEKSLDPLVTIANTAQQWKKAIHQVTNLAFTKEMQQERNLVLQNFTDKKSVNKLMKILTLRP